MKKAIAELLKSNIKSREELMTVKRELSKKYGIQILLNSDVLKEYKKMVKNKLIVNSPFLEKLLRKRSIRTMSGIAPVAVLTNPYPCPGKCVYCPTEKDVPQSYLSNEPAVMRAIRCGYEPSAQVGMRLRALEANGHQPNKIELIVIGGTWSVLPEKYKYWYIKECFRAANKFELRITPATGQANYELKINKKKINSQLVFNKSLKSLKKDLEIEQKKNEKAKYRIIGVTLETRPDYIDDKELWQMREFGCTRVELGVQAVDDKILKLNKRGHGVKEIVGATKLLKDFGFKVTYHIMPGLPGSTAVRDIKMYRQLFSDERFQPDQIKFYPTVVTKGSLLYRWWKNGKYKPYTKKVLQNLILKCKEATPPYVRIIRLIRDIPGESIIAGNTITNLRQVLKDKGAQCRCIRCRESGELRIKNYELRIIKYTASGGTEYFISAESKDGKTLYGFCRLRLNLHNTQHVKHNNLFDSAIIRELHVYGELVPVGSKKKTQHSGLGKLLMKEAERIVKEAKYEKIAVISGVGVREYYRKLGYKLKNSYMLKDLTELY
jgi:elongator complex protein 3